MRVRVLGSAAGGGLPQWNCACRNCGLARCGAIPARTQSSVALSADGERWFLLNASPDLRAQIEAFPPLQPSPETMRGSPIEGVLVTNADLDHTLGLFALREGGGVRVHASEAVRQSLAGGLNLDAVLGAFSGITWTAPPETPEPLRRADGSASGLLYRAIPLSGKPPRFARPGGDGEGHVLAYELTDVRTGGRLLFAPDVADFSAPLDAALERADAVLFDGTFWSQTELIDLGAGHLSADEMGHWPVSESLPLLAKRPGQRRIYLHINNTNPMLDPDSPEHAAVQAAGIGVAEDEWEFEL